MNTRLTHKYNKRIWRSDLKTASLQIGKWLNEELRPNCFATVTFKQCKHHGQGVREWINRDIADSTCNELMQRCTKKFKKLVTGSDPNPFQWVTFSEDGKGSKRLHAHLAIHTSDLIAYDEFSTIFRDLCTRFDWVDDRIDIQQLHDEGDHRKVIFYCLKEGADAFRPNASHLVLN